MRLSAHFDLAEMTSSSYATRAGLNNTPPQDVVVNLKRLAAALEMVRRVLGHPVIITSGYRSALVNKGIGGSRNSAHIRGLAADFVCPAFGSPRAICQEIVLAGVPFDQMIHEGSWVHFAIPEDGAGARRQILTAHFKGGSVSYTTGLPA